MNTQLKNDDREPKTLEEELELYWQLEEEKKQIEQSLFNEEGFLNFINNVTKKYAENL